MSGPRPLGLRGATLGALVLLLLVSAAAAAAPPSTIRAPAATRVVGSRIAFMGNGFARDGKKKEDTPIHIVTSTGRPVATIPLEQVTDIDW